jgi:tetratricopeptide (TPR) repeat protein
LPAVPGKKPTEGPPAPDAVSTPPDRQTAQEAFLEGLKFQKAQDWDQAIRSYKRALEHDRKFAEASYNLGLAYKDNGNMEMAKDALLYTLSIRPDMTRAGYMLAIVEKRPETRTQQRQSSLPDWLGIPDRTPF